MTDFTFPTAHEIEKIRREADVARAQAMRKMFARLFAGLTSPRPSTAH